MSQKKKQQKQPAAKKKANPNINKRQREADAIAKAKRKRNTTIGVSIVVVIASVAIFFLISNWQKGNRVYTDGYQDIVLRKSGSFTAQLAHYSFKGTYAESGQTIVFTVDGEDVEGSISGEILTLPLEWEDGHGHGLILTLK